MKLPGKCEPKTSRPAAINSELPRRELFSLFFFYGENPGWIYDFNVALFPIAGSPFHLLCKVYIYIYKPTQESCTRCYEMNIKTRRDNGVVGVSLLIPAARVKIIETKGKCIIYNTMLTNLKYKRSSRKQYSGK